MEACAQSLAKDLAAASSSVASSAATAANLPPSSSANAAVVVGVSEGLTYINRGSNSGLRAGQVLQVYRLSTVPGLSDPDTGKPLTRKNQICTLTLSDVEETNASGKCVGDLPASRDNADLGSSGPGSVPSLQSGAGGGGNCAGNGLADGTGRGPAGSLVVGNGVSAPVLLSQALPEYTEEARTAKLQGTVVLSLVVDAGGHPTLICVVRGLGLGLDQKAVEAVQKWRFRPGMKDGKLVAVYATVEVNFRLQ